MHVTKALAAIFLGLACSCYALPQNAVDAIHVAEPGPEPSDISKSEGRLAPLELEAHWMNGKANNDMVAFPIAL